MISFRYLSTLLAAFQCDSSKQLLNCPIPLRRICRVWWQSTSSNLLAPDTKVSLVLWYSFDPPFQLRAKVDRCANRVTYSYAFRSVRVPLRCILFDSRRWCPPYDWTRYLVIVVPSRGLLEGSIRRWSCESDQFFFILWGHECMFTYTAISIMFSPGRFYKTKVGVRKNGSVLGQGSVESNVPAPFGL